MRIRTGEQQPARRTWRVRGWGAARAPAGATPVSRSGLRERAGEAAASGGVLQDLRGRGCGRRVRSGRSGESQTGQVATVWVLWAAAREEERSRKLERAGRGVVRS